VGGGSGAYWLFDIIREILGVQELIAISKALVSRLEKRSCDATLRKSRQSRLNDGQHALSGRLNKHCLINLLRAKPDETVHLLNVSQICLTTIFARLLSQSREAPPLTTAFPSTCYTIKGFRTM
jgi:hypothetical protein